MDKEGEEEGEGAREEEGGGNGYYGQGGPRRIF